MQMQFVKMQGAGNDFVVIDGFQFQLPEEKLGDAARFLCDRHFGVGSDGIILVLPSKSANFRMRMFNPDGSEAEMCGNGIRCFGKYVFDRDLTTERRITVETAKGVQELKLDVVGGKVHAVRVDMGEPRLQRREIPMTGAATPQVVGEKLKVEGEKFDITCVSMGNPHCMLFVKDVDLVPVEKLGPAIENHNVFPERTNVQFVEVLRPDEIKVRTWERGAGVTLACGTGASASLVAAVLNDKTQRKATVHLPGGDLFIEWLGNNHVMMTGPAVEVFAGQVDV